MNRPPKPNPCFPRPLSCPVMSPAELARVTVDFSAIAADGLLRNTLDRYGMAVVTNVLSADECRDLEGLLLRDFCELLDDAPAGSPESVVQAVTRARTSVANWPQATIDTLGPQRACGRLANRGLPHGRFSWAARLHPRVRQVYATVHGCAPDDLVSSCDNAFFVPRDLPVPAVTNSNWPHVDQNDLDSALAQQLHLHTLREWDVYQGVLYVWSSEQPAASTTVVWPGSNNPDIYGEYLADYRLANRGRRGEHFTAISMMAEGPGRARLVAGWTEQARRIPVPAGALLLWNSRTTHQGWSGGARLAQPVCWEPRRLREAAGTHERKLRIAAIGLPSTHSASHGRPHTLADFAKPAPLAASGSSDPNSVVLPLKPSVRSQALLETGTPDLDELWTQLGLLTHPLSADASRMLQACVREDFKRYL